MNAQVSERPVVNRTPAAERRDRAPGPARLARLRSNVLPVLGLVPFLAFVTVFLIVPVLVNVWTSLHDAEGAFTLGSLARLFEGQYRSAFLNTARLSLVTALLGGAFGLVIAWALATIQRPRWLKSLMLSFTAVASQQGGIPLAFAFVATIGVQGLVTVFARDTFGLNLTEMIGLSSFSGLVVVYLYFQAPLMAVLVLPALMGVRKEWLESATSLGAGRLRYLVDVAFPILSPAIVGSMLLLFANAFSAYATAYALAGSGANLVPILIGFFISGNVMADDSFGAALVTGMIVVIGIALVLRILLMRRTTRWLR